MSRLQASCLLLLAALLWGSGNVVQQTILQHMGPLMANGLRCLIAALAVSPFCWSIELVGHPLDRKGKLHALLLVLSFTAATATLQVAYGLTTVSNAGFLANTSTILTPVFAWLLLRELPRPLIVPAAIFAFAGICMLGGGWPGSFTWGDSLCLIAAAFFAFWMVLQGRFVMHYGRAAQLTLVQFLGCGFTCIVISMLFESKPTNISTDTAVQLAYSGLIATGGGYLLLAIGQRFANASEAAIVISAEAVFGACFAHMLLGEQQNLTQIAGAALIISAILLIETPTKQLVRVLERGSALFKAVKVPVAENELPDQQITLNL